MKKLQLIGWLVALMLSTLSHFGANAMGKDEIEEAETLLMSDYLEQKIFAEISLPSRKALSNLREKEIIFTALNNSPSSRELMASLMAAGLDVSSERCQSATSYPNS